MLVKIGRIKNIRNQHIDIFALMNIDSTTVNLDTIVWSLNDDVHIMYLKISNNSEVSLCCWEV